MFIGEPVITDEDSQVDGVQWTDTGNGADIIGDVNVNYFYRVTGFITLQSNLEIESEPSNVAGESDYQLITTLTTDINEIKIPMDTRKTRLPITTAEELAQAIPNCTDVYCWIPDGQGSEGHVKGLPFNNFPVYQGYPYIVNVSDNGVWSTAGSLPDTSFSLITTPETDVNHIGISFSKGYITNAEELAQDIPDCTDVYSWDPSGQGSVGHVKGLPFNNFPVKACHPYWVNMEASIVWPEIPEPLPKPIVLSSAKNTAEPTHNGKVTNGVPHIAYGKLSTTTKFMQEKNLKLRAWIESRPEEILTHLMVGTGIDKEYWFVGVGNFSTSWSIGEILVVEIEDISNKMIGQVKVLLSDAGSDLGAEITLYKNTDSLEGMSDGTPKEYVLLPGYPNPFNPETTISYGLPERSEVSIRIYDSLGRVVRTLVNKTHDEGYFKAVWNGRDDSGNTVSAGLYLCEMVSSNHRHMIKLMLMK